MAKIGRNAPCFCGSGKKYKNCHIGIAPPVSKPAQPKKSDQEVFSDLVNSHSSKQVLGVLAALQLHTQNHGRNFRFEQLCRLTLKQFSPDDNRPLASWENLQNAIGNYTHGGHMEDPLTNAFTENIVFEEGNYTVLPGIYEGFAEILNHFIECIFLQSHSLDKAFVKTVRDALGLLLTLSESISKDSSLELYLYPEETSSNVEFPKYDVFEKFVEACYFSKEYLQEISNSFGYELSVLKYFLTQPGSKEIDEEDPDKNIVNFKPLVDLGHGILVYMPTGIVNALISYIKQKAHDSQCYDHFLELVYERQFVLSRLALLKSGWIGTTIKLPDLKTDLPIIETVFQFDNQKLAYVCYLKTGRRQSEQNQEPESLAHEQFNLRAEEVVQHLSNIDPQQTFGIFCLYILGEIGSDFLFSWSAPSVGNQILALKYREFQTICNAPKFSRFMLWKFAKSYSRTSELTKIMNIGGMMDAYYIYQKNHGSLLHSEEDKPSTGGIVIITNGTSNSFYRKIKKRKHEHAVPTLFQKKRAFTIVTRYRDYAPIYKEKEIRDSFRLVIECFKMPIWIITSQVKPGKENWATYVCEAIAFWLNKMSPVLSPHINEQDLIQFEIEIIIAEELLSADHYERKEVDVNKISLGDEIVAPQILIKIPFDFLYLVMLPNNLADKILLKSTLQGIINYIHASGGQTHLNSQLIESIIDQELQPSIAKMIMFSNATANIKMDDRNLPPMHYLNETDVSYVLDNLVSYLPKGYSIPADIKENTEKRNLCDSIVTALIHQITIRIAAFDGIALLKWLIKMNEKGIQVREFREISIPAKIACFSSFQAEVDIIMDGERNMVKTAHSLRTLIELVATKIPTGTKWPNFDDIDELLALTDQLTEWGSQSESIRLEIDNPKMGVLPSGRIGVEKTTQHNAFTPYAVAKTESAIFQYIEDFESNYAPRFEEGESRETDESNALDAAFKAEFGITLFVLSKIIGALMNEGFTQAKSCVEIEHEVLKKLLLAVDGLTNDDIDKVLDLLTLLERESIGVKPAGEIYTTQDIFPWRFSRSISYIRRPLIKVTKDHSTRYLFGYRHLRQYMDTLLGLLQSAKLPARSPEMVSWLSERSGEKGTPFRNSVKKWMEKNSNFEIIQDEIKMDKDVSAPHIQTDKNYGDIDLLVIDHSTLTIYPIECKNIHGGRNVHEMKVEMDDYLGRPGSNKKGKIQRHLDRDTWLKKNKPKLSHLVTDAENYTIKSMVLTADEVSLTYLKQDSLPLPIKSFTNLRRFGLKYLINDIKDDSLN